MTEFAQYLLDRPLLLVPLLVLASAAIYAILKRLMKVLAVVAIAAALYLVLLEYASGGF